MHSLRGVQHVGLVLTQCHLLAVLCLPVLQKVHSLLLVIAKAGCGPSAAQANTGQPAGAC